MGRTEGENESFIAIRMRIHQKFFLDPLMDFKKKKKKRRPKAMPKFVMCIYGVFAIVSVLRG